MRAKTPADRSALLSTNHVDADRHSSRSERTNDLGRLWSSDEVCGPWCESRTRGRDDPLSPQGLRTLLTANCARCPLDTDEKCLIASLHGTTPAAQWEQGPRSGSQSGDWASTAASTLLSLPTQALVPVPSRLSQLSIPRAGRTSLSSFALLQPSPPTSRLR